MSERFFVYDPRNRQWLTEMRDWTPALKEAWGFYTYRSANTERERCEREYADGEFHVTSVKSPTTTVHRNWTSS
jgi:hypothetical protein